MERTKAIEIPPTEPEYECETCGLEILDYYTCKGCGCKLDLDDFYCDNGKEHYCAECGEEMEKKEEAKDKPIPGQLPMFNEKGDASK